MGLIYLQSMSYPPRHQKTHTIIVKKNRKSFANTENVREFNIFLYN